MTTSGNFRQYTMTMEKGNRFFRASLQPAIPEYLPGHYAEKNSMVSLP